MQWNSAVFVVSLLIAAAALPAQTSAQEQISGQNPIRTGARVRMMPAAPATAWTTGRVDLATPETLRLTTRSGSQEVSLADAQRLEVSRGRRRALWTVGGVLVGAAAGVIYTRASNTEDPGDIGGIADVADGVGNTILGMVAGGAAGYFVAPERWFRVSLPLRF